MHNLKPVSQINNSRLRIHNHQNRQEYVDKDTREYPIPQSMTPLGYKIFLDRYALKNLDRNNLCVGDLVVAIVNEHNQREIGYIVDVTFEENYHIKMVTVDLLGGERITLPADHVDKPIETTPDQVMDRTAAGAAEAEANERLEQEWTDNFRWLLDDWKFVPGGRILTTLGTDQKLSAFNCFTIPCPKDSRSGIINTLSEMTEIMSRGGGVGINISTLRPKNAYVKGVNGRSSGSVSWGALYSYTTGLIEQAGCLYKTSNITTDKGTLPVNKIVELFECGDTINAWTHKGWKPITDVFRNGVKKVYRLKTKQGYTLDATANHPIMTMNIDTAIPELVNLSDIKISDTVFVLKGNRPDMPFAQLNTTVTKRTKFSKEPAVKILPKLLDDDLAYLIGYFIANGSTILGESGSEGFCLAINKNFKYDIRYLNNLMAKLFPEAHIGLQNNPNRGWISLRIYSTAIVDFLETNGLSKTNSNTARVPELIKRSGQSVVKAFLAGYMAADGCFVGQPYLSSASEKLTEELQQLFLSVNVPSRRYYVTKITETEDGEPKEFIIHILSFPGKLAQENLREIVDGRCERSDDFIPSSQERSWVWPVNLTIYGQKKNWNNMHNGKSDSTSIAAVAKVADTINTENISLVNACVPAEVESVEYVGDFETFDITVDQVHLLSANGIYTSNSRRGALILILNDWHPDIFDFINSKREAGKITNANISVGVSDKLMEAVKTGADWELRFPDTNDPDYNDLWDGDLDTWEATGRKVIVYKTVKARELWDAIIESAWASAEPGVWFRERANKLSNSWYFNPLIATNPCAEQSLGAFSICNLGSLNLAKFFNPVTLDVDWTELERATTYAVRFLDNIIDVAYYPLPETKERQLSERRVGLGTMGIADLMIRLGIRYGSPEAVTFTDEIFRTIAVTAYQASIDLAREKGAFPEFNAKKFLESGFMRQMPEDICDNVRDHGIRNVTLLTQAPTGSIGTMVNTSTGIEPFFSWVYYRKGRLGIHEEVVKIAQEYIETHFHVGENGPHNTPTDISDYVDYLPDYFVAAMDLTPREHIDIQAAAQRWIDSSISKTANVPNNYTVEQTAELYEYLYQSGCKGGTIYRDGSRDEQVLTLKNSEKTNMETNIEMGIETETGININTNTNTQTETETKTEIGAETEIEIEIKTGCLNIASRPLNLHGFTTRINTPFGRAYITINEDEYGNPFEVFIIAPGKAGSDLQADAEGIGRLVSLVLRMSPTHERKNALVEIVTQLEFIGGSQTIGFGKNQIMSLPDAIASVLRQYCVEETQTNIKTKPAIKSSTGADLDYTNGQFVFANKPENTNRALLCPECRTYNLIRHDGCKQCIRCGYSAC